MPRKVVAGERYRETNIDEEEEEARKGVYRAGNEARMIKRDRMAIAPERTRNNLGKVSLLAFCGESRRFAILGYAREGYGQNRIV